MAAEHPSTPRAPETLILQAVTSLHVGEGHAVGAIDLPCIRERHTRWPTAAGSSLKGALRARAEALVGPEGKARIEHAFGPERVDTTAELGTIRVGAATLLALPVRSLKGCFCLLSCPHALARLARSAGGAAPALPSVRPERAHIGSGFRGEIPTRGIAHGVDSQGVVVLEEIAWPSVRDPLVDGWVTFLARWLGDEAPLGQLVIVHDDVFAHAAQRWTEVRTRAAIGADGVVEEGKLFTLEALPPETLLWTRLHLRPPARRKDEPMDDCVALLPENGDTWHLGGDRSVGMGRVAWYRRKEAP